MFHTNRARWFSLLLFGLWPSGFTTAEAQQITLTPSQTEGPYYGPNTPAKPDFRPDVEATTPANWPDLFVTGRVYNQYGIPQAGAKIDLWHADASGAYDESSVLPVTPPVTYTLRGYVTTDGDGDYSWATIVPGLYPGRTRHIHFKVFETTSSAAAVTSQLYFPTPYDTDADFDGAGDITNAATLARDGIYRSTTSLLLDVLNQPSTDGYYQASYDFVISTSDPAPNGQDLTGDGTINVTDLERLQKGIREFWPAPSLNLDGNGVTDSADITTWLTRVALAQGLTQAFARGDANLDGQFDSADLVRVFQPGEYEDATTGNSGWSEGDWNGDGDFGTPDLLLAFQEGRYASNTFATTVPEPTASASLVAILLWACRRSRRATS